jgi:hypothetical protein
MLNIHQDVFDKKWLDDISHILMREPWFASNVANNKTWPYGLKGTHLLLGNTHFSRLGNNKIHYSENISLVDNLIASFEAIENKVKRKMKLMEISANLQFKGMDGTLHKDGSANQSVFILMLANENIFGNMGGEFFHQPTNKKIEFSHGKLIEQNGEDLHMGLAFNKPYIARMSIKYVGEII